MPYVSVHVDAEDVLEDLSEQDLRDELARRANKKGRQYHSANFMIPQPVAIYTLNEAADILRKQGRNDLAFKLEEVREDYVAH